ncbi:MAG: hypothetical protein ACYS30_19700 [Planctomycetota bacterium]|jgi:hypothetical protein
MSLKSFIIAALFPIITLAGKGGEKVSLPDPNGEADVIRFQVRQLRRYIAKQKGAEKRSAEKDAETLDSLDTQG